MEPILTFLVSSNIQHSLLWLKILFFLLSVAMLGYIAYFLWITRWFKFYFWYSFVEFFTIRLYGSVGAAIHWGHIQRKLQNPSPEACREIIIESHNLLDRLLERLAPMYLCNTFAERLARIGSGTFSSLDGLWQAHELYRTVQKDPAYEVQPGELKATVDAYQQALIDLEIIK